MADSKTINNNTSQRLFSQSERFQNRANQRLKEFLKHHNCDGCSGCGLHESFQQKKIEFFNNESQSFSVLNGSDKKSSSSSNKNSIIDEIIASKKADSNGMNNNNSAVAHGPNCSCNSCSGKATNIDELLNSLLSNKTVIEERNYSNSTNTDSNNKKIFDKVHASDCTCDSCTSKRQNIDELFKQLKINVLPSDRIEENSDNNSRVVNKSYNNSYNLSNISEKSSKLLNSNSIYFNNSSFDNIKKPQGIDNIITSSILIKQVNVRDNYQNSTHVFASNENKTIVSNNNNIISSNNQYNSDTNSIIFDQKTYEQSYLFQKTNTFRLTYSEQKNINHNFKNNSSNTLKLSHENNYNLNKLSLIPSFAEVMAIPWLRKLYGHLYGLTDLDDESQNQSFNSNTKAKAKINEHFDKFKSNLEFIHRKLFVFKTQISINVKEVVDNSFQKTNFFFTKIKDEITKNLERLSLTSNSMVSNFKYGFYKLLNNTHNFFKNINNQVQQLINHSFYTIRQSANELKILFKQINVKVNQISKKFNEQLYDLNIIKIKIFNHAEQQLNNLVKNMKKINQIINNNVRDAFNIKLIKEKISKSDLLFGINLKIKNINKSFVNQLMEFKKNLNQKINFLIHKISLKPIIRFKENLTQFQHSIKTNLDLITVKLTNIISTKVIPKLDNLNSYFKRNFTLLNLRINNYIIKLILLIKLLKNSNLSSYSEKLTYFWNKFNIIFRMRDLYARIRNLFSK